MLPPAGLKIEKKTLPSGSSALDKKRVQFEERDEYNQTHLHKAAFEGKIDEIYEMIMLDVEINPRDKNDWTPLHCAASRENLMAMMVLLKVPSIDVNAVTKSQTTALHYLCRNRFDEKPEDIPLAKNIIARFKALGANIDAGDKYQETPLYQACKRKVFWAIECLVENGADVNVKAKDNATPFVCSVLLKDIEACKFLIEHGATIEAVDCDAHFCDAFKNFTEIQQFLRLSAKKNQSPTKSLGEDSSENASENSGDDDDFSDDEDIESEETILLPPQKERRVRSETVVFKNRAIVEGISLESLFIESIVFFCDTNPSL